MQNKSGNSSSPRIKWEVLLVGIIVTAIAIAMMFLCFFRELMVGFPLPLVAVVAYGWPFGLMAGTFSVAAIFEEFLPSYREAKEFKERQNFFKKVKSALRESRRFSDHKAAERMEDFERCFPKYRRV